MGLALGCKVQCPEPVADQDVFGIIIEFTTERQRNTSESLTVKIKSFLSIKKVAVGPISLKKAIRLCVIYFEPYILPDISALEHYSWFRWILVEKYRHIFLEDYFGSMTSVWTVLSQKSC